MRKSEQHDRNQPSSWVKIAGFFSAVAYIMIAGFIIGKVDSCDTQPMQSRPTVSQTVANDNDGDGIPDHKEYMLGMTSLHH